MEIWNYGVCFIIVNPSLRSKVLDYNASKDTVDTMDKMVTEYSCYRKTERWPLMLFFNLLNLATRKYILHKIILYVLHSNNSNNHKTACFYYIKLHKVRSDLTLGLHSSKKKLVIRKLLSERLYYLFNDRIN